MLTIQQTHRTCDHGRLPGGSACGFSVGFESAYGLLVALFSFLSIATATAQDAADAPPADTVHKESYDGRSFEAVKVVSNKMNIDLTENFSKELEFNEKLLTVDQFDDTVISVKAQGPNRLRIQGLDQGVTTMVITSETNQKYFIEVFVSGDARHLQAVLKRRFPNSAIECDKLINGNILLTGFVTDNQTITQIMEVASLYGPLVINQMRVGGPQEVQLRVKILEVQRSKLRTFGIDMYSLTQSSVLASSPGAITPLTGLINPIGGNPSAGIGQFAANTPSLMGGFSGNHFAFSFFIQALKEEGLLKVMSEPVVVTRSGEPARIADGGEFPITVPGGLGTVTIEFREFGVILETLPIVVSPTRVKQMVKAIVSDKDEASAITLNGTKVPGLSKREVYSTVEMNFGETMVIAGLVNTRELAATLKIPVLGEIPGLGALFSKKTYQQSETELIILVTPEFGSSLTADQIPPGGPGQFTTAPVDRELILHGLIEVPRYAPENGMDCPPNGVQPAAPNHYYQQQPGMGLPTPRQSGPNPTVTPSTVPQRNGNGLIEPPGAGPNDAVPPSPNDSVTRRSGSRSAWPAKARPATSNRRKETDDSVDSDPVMPAGFSKAPKKYRVTN